MKTRWLLGAALVAAACGANHAEDRSDAGAGVDASADATPGGPDAMPGDPDAMPGPDAMPASPFPADPHAGQFAWAVVIPGAGDQVVLAAIPGGGAFVAATHRGPIDLDGVHLPAPVGSAIVILELDAQAHAVWGRSLGGGDPTWQTNVRSATVAANGDLIIGGTFVGAGFDAGLGPLPAAGMTDGFVARFDGATGTPRWARSFGHAGDDEVTTVAADPASDALYVFGELSGQTVNGQWQDGGAFLERVDAAGQPVWSHTLALQLAWQHGMTLDPTRGPIVSGVHASTLDVGGQQLALEPGDQRGDTAVIGYTPDGEVRFVRRIFTDTRVSAQRLLAAPDGQLYFAAATGANELVFDDEVGVGDEISSDVVLARLDPTGARAWSTLIDAQYDAAPRALAVDAQGASYLVGSCDLRVALAPAIPCAAGGSFLASYGPAGDYRWATYVDGSPAWAEAIAAVPGANRVLLAGEVGPGANGVDFGGVRVDAAGLFIAAVATGPTWADPLPPPPAVSAVTLDGVLDGQVRQGGAGTLVITGANLAAIHAVRVGSRDLFVDNATAGEIRIPYVVPHGEPVGPLRVVLTYAGGQLAVATGVTITPIVVSPYGSSQGRGTPSSPWALCRDDWQTVARRGDVIHLLAGQHTCGRALYVNQGVTVEGAGATLTRVVSTVGGPHGSFAPWDGPHGTTTFRDLAIATGEFGAIHVFGDPVAIAVRDVDFVGLSTPGIELDFARGRVELQRVRYLDGASAAVYADGDVTVTGDAVQVDTTADGFAVRTGVLALRDATIHAGGAAIVMGNINETSTLPRRLWLERVALTGAHGVVSNRADLEVRESDIAGTGASGGAAGIEFIGGELALAGTRIHGFEIGIMPAPGLAGDEVANLDLDDAAIDASYVGVIAGEGSTLRMRRSTVAGGLLVTMPFLTLDLGTAASPGANALTSAASGHALEDRRSQVGDPIDASGTLLNGHSYSGAVVGPRADADLAQTAANTVRF